MSSHTQQFGGEHTDEKLKILRLYLDYFTTVLKNQPSASQPFQLFYVDPFCGAGYWEPRGEDSEREGSPLIALSIDERPFDELIFNDSDPENVSSLKSIVDQNYTDRTVRLSVEPVDEFVDRVSPNLSKAIHPNIRGVIFLDPFATQLGWSSVEKIAGTQTLDVLLLFPRQALARSSPNRLRRGEDHRFQSVLTHVFGDESWRQLYDDEFIREFDAVRAQAGDQTPTLFDLAEIEPNPEYEFRAHTSAISYLYREKLSTVFAGVSETHAVLTSNGTPIFEVHFAVSNPSRNAQVLAQRGANYILRNFRNVQIQD